MLRFVQYYKGYLEYIIFYYIAIAIQILASKNHMMIMKTTFTWQHAAKE